MTNTLNFPNRPVREWLIYENKIREAFGSFPQITNDETDRVCAVLRPLFMNAAESDAMWNDEMTGDERVVALNDWVSKQIFTLLWAVAFREFELNRLR